MVGGYNRKISFQKAIRRRKISRFHSYFGEERFDNLHQYSKNQIYCSCPMCTRKTNNRSKRRMKKGNYYPTKDWKHSDLMKMIGMEDELKEYEELGNTD